MTFDKCPSSRKLHGDSSKSISIPASVVLDRESNDQRVTAFSFFAVRRGLDNAVEFSINSLVRWSGRKPDRHEGRINDSIAKAVNRLVDEGHVSIHGDIGHASYAEASFNASSYNRYAVLYVDEIKRIFKYSNTDRSKFANMDIVLLVLAYLRLMIWRKTAEEPEAWSGFYSDIADDLGVNEKSVSKSIEILKKMGIIYYENLPRKKYKGKWTTTHTVFCNMYKRYRDTVVAEGEDYYMTEVENKKRQLNVFDRERGDNGDVD